MCSDENGPAASDQVARLTQAIDELAAAKPGSLTAMELTGRVALVWTLVGDLDPDLARRAADYGSAATAPPGPAGSASPGSSPAGPAPRDPPPASDTR
ncbi:MAG TPA: hypothetical protein VLW50_16300 [Streptosporangiaceae bacterium]|nr:hypothetical protein [Streptosporangiaceae bacterium]